MYRPNHGYSYPVGDIYQGVKRLEHEADLSSPRMHTAARAAGQRLQILSLAVYYKEYGMLFGLATS
jgi:hypothetical protein